MQQKDVARLTVETCAHFDFLKLYSQLFTLVDVTRFART